MKKLIVEIFDEAEKSEQPTKVLEENRTIYMDQFIDLMKAGVQWALPETDPPFKKERDLPIESSDANLYTMLRRFYIFETKTQIQQVKREMIFIQMLEALHWREAQLVLDLKNGMIPHKYPKLWKAVGGRPVEPIKTEEVVEEKPAAKTEEPKPEKPKRGWFNDGVNTRMFVVGQEPEGWVRGKLT